MRAIKLRLAVKMGLSLSIVFLIVGIATAHRMYREAEAILEHQIIGQIQGQAFQKMDKIDRVLYERYTEARMLAADPVVRSRSSSPKQVSDRLAEYLNGHKFYASLTFYGPRGARIADATATRIGAQRRLEDHAIAIPQGRSFASGVYLSAILDKPMLYFAFPVKDVTGAPLGVVVSRMLMDVFSEMAGQAAGFSSSKGTFNIDLVDRDGRLLYSNYDEEGVLQSESEDWEFIEDRVAGGQMRGYLRFANPKEKFGDELLVFAHARGYLDYEGIGWTLIIFTPTSVAFAPAIAFLRTMTIILSGGGVVILFIMIMLLRKFIAPLTGLRDAMEVFGKGGPHVRVAAASNDEIGAISGTFNMMAAEIEGARETLQDHAENLEREVASRTAELQATLAELKKKEKSLVLSEKKFSTLFLSSPEAIVISTLRDGTYREVNDAYLLMSGYSRAELIGRSALDIGIWESAADREKILAALREQGRVVNQETRFLTKSGKVLDVLRTASMIDYEDELCMISSTRDIAELKSAERALKRSKEFIETIFNSMNDAIAIVDIEDFTIIDANSVFVERSELPKAEIIGKLCHEITHRKAEPCIAHGEACPITAMVKTRSTCTLEHLHHLKDGSIQYVEVTATPMFNEKGDVVQAVYMTRDITERKLAEEKVRKSEERYRNLFDSTLDGVYEVNAEGVFTQMNPAGAKIFGYSSPEEIIGTDAVNRWQDVRDREVFRAELKLKKSVSAYYMPSKKKDGELLDLESSSRIIEDGEGNFLGITGILRDVTERRQAEADREQLIQQLQRALAEVRALSGMLPICSSCKKIRDDKGYWNQIESYISEHSGAEFSHGICPECEKKVYEELNKMKGNRP